MNALDNEAAVNVLESANESGINFYDHADICGKGELKNFCESFEK